MWTTWIAFAAMFVGAALCVAGLWVRRKPLIAAALAGGIAIIAGASFALSGGPPARGEPIARRVAELRAADPASLNNEQRLALLESLARERPLDPQTHRYFADELERAGRFFESVQARERVVSLEPSAGGYAALGGSLVALNDGEVSPEALSAFEAALGLDAGNIAANWYLGVERLQSGDSRAAAERWGALLARLEDDGARRDALAAEAVELLARPRAGPGEPSAAPVAETETAPTIEGMLAGLERRLTDDPGDLSGWLALARARTVLGESELARAALDDAQSAHEWDDGSQLLLTAARRLYLSDRSDEQG